jgi:hypothetical protein
MVVCCFLSEPLIVQSACKSPATAFEAGKARLDIPVRFFFFCDKYYTLLMCPTIGVFRGRDNKKPATLWSVRVSG